MSFTANFLTCIASLLSENNSALHKFQYFHLMMIEKSHQATEQSANNLIDQISPSKLLAEIKRHSTHFHIIGAWVAIFFDPIFGITDYLNIPEHWVQIMVLRVSISLITLGALILHKKGKIDTFLLISVPISLISLQNAYTYSLIGAEDLLGHNLNYLALFMGAGLFILWPVRYSLISIFLSLIASFYFVSTNNALQLGEFAVEGGILLIAGALFTVFLIEARYRLRLREIKATLALNAQLEITAQQKLVIEGMNERLIGYNQELEREVAARTASLKKANEERDRLVYRLSHDFKTPILNFRSMISMITPNINDEQLKKVMNHLAINLDRFDELLGDMMNYAVYSNEQLSPQAIDLTKKLGLVWESLQFLHHHEYKPHIEITQQPSGSFIQDPEKVRVVFFCLLSNAIRYRSTQKETKISIQIHLDESGIAVTILDNGAGIPNAALPKVFDMFYRGDVRSTGAGMGLFITRGILEQLGGTIEIASTSENGTEISFKIPTLK